jgi:RND family efflux transporter MFP subunit
MKSWFKWLLAGLVVALLGTGIFRVISARKVQSEALEAQQQALKTQTAIDLTPPDLVQASTMELAQGLAISGAIKAINSAFVKARVAGELQGLTAREGDFIKAGDILARVDTTETQARVRQAQEQAKAAKAQVEIARRSFDNGQALVTQGFISKTALDSSSANLMAAEANYRAALAGADVALKALQDTVLRAPISGQVSQRIAQPGERVSVDARIVEIVDLSHLELEASLNAADILKVRVGQVAQLNVEGSTQPLIAKVARINPSAMVGSRAVLAYLSLEPNSGLRQGMFVEGTLQTGMTRVLALPLGAVRTDKPLPYVQAVDKGLVTHQTVELGAQGKKDGISMVEVKGIQEGAIVLSATMGSVRAGTPAKTPAGAK